MENYTYLNVIESLGIGGAHPGGPLLTKLILDKEKLRKESVVLDAGCGTGQTSAFIFNKYHCHVYSLDINQGLLLKAKKRFNHFKIPAKIIHGDIQRIPFQSFFFDYVLSESVLPFTNIPKSVSEFYRVLKDGGILIANEMTVEGTISEQETRILKDFYGFTDFLTEKKWIDLFRSYGLEIIETIHPNDVAALSKNAMNQTEFDLSAEISEEIFLLLDKHEYFMNKYKDKLSYRVYKLKKTQVLKS